MVAGFNIANAGSQNKIFSITLPSYWSSGTNKYIDFQVPVFFKFSGSNNPAIYAPYVLSTQTYSTIYVRDSTGNTIDVFGTSSDSRGNYMTIQGNSTTSRTIETQNTASTFSAIVLCNNYLFRYYPRLYTTSITLNFYAIFNWQLSCTTSSALSPSVYGILYNNNNNTTNKSIFSTGTNYKSGSSDVSISIVNTSYTIIEVIPQNTYGKILCQDMNATGTTTLQNINMNGNITFNNQTLTNMSLQPTYYFPSWTSGWFYVTTNQIYNFNTWTDGYEINLNYPPMLQILFCGTATPNLTVHTVFDITGQGMNSSFSQSYIFRYYDTRTVSIKTGVNNVALTIENTDNHNLSYTYGYYNIILR